MNLKTKWAMENSNSGQTGDVKFKFRSIIIYNENDASSKQGNVPNRLPTKDSNFDTPLPPLN